MSEVGFSYTVEQNRVIDICEDINPIQKELINFSSELSTYLSNLSVRRGFERLDKSVLPEYQSVGTEYASLLGDEGNKLYSLAGIAYKFDSGDIETDALDSENGWWNWNLWTSALL